MDILTQEMFIVQQIVVR